MRISDEHRDLIAQLQGMEVPETPCLECIPNVVGLEVTHADDCAASNDVEVVCASDREWFDTHPATDFFYRDVSWGEAAQLLVTSPIMNAPLLSTCSISTAGRVRVERLQEGARIRRFDDVYFVLEQDSEEFA